MKIAELSQRSGVPVPTIKFYIREGLLQAGTRTAKNQASYSNEHLARLALIRAMKDDAGFGINAIARALRAADAAQGTAISFIGAAIDAVERPSGAPVDEKTPEFRRALEDVKDTAKERAWAVDKHSTALRDAARALVVIRRSFPHVVPGPYAAAAERVAEFEIPDDWQPDQAPNQALHYAVLGTVLGEPLLLALRRMAHVARSAHVAERKAPAPRGKPARSDAETRPGGAKSGKPRAASAKSRS
jgi:DNA-binding transcriptional MerR regulator